MKKMFSVLSVVIGLCFAYPALAADQPMKMNMETAKTMMSSDGTISKDSFMKHGGTQAQWEKMDLDKNGLLDAKEIKLGFTEKY